MVRIPPGEKENRLSRKYSVLVAVTLVIIILSSVAGLFWANYSNIKSRSIDKSFLIPWIGGRTYLQYGISPYDEATSKRAQVIYYGHLAANGEDPLYLTIPLMTEFLYFPFSVIPDYTIARALWMMFEEFAILASILLVLSIIKWRPKSLLLLFVLCSSPLWFYSIGIIENGSPAGIVSLGIMGAIYAIQHHKEELAGGSLFLIFLEPQIAVVFLAVMTWYVISNRKWRALWGFIMTLTFPVILSFILLPNWLIPFLRNTYTIGRHTSSLNVSGLLNNWWPALGLKISIGLFLFLSGLLFLELRNTPKGDDEKAVWNFSLAFAITPLIGLSTYLDGHFLLILPLLLIYKVSHDRWKGRWFFIGLTVILILILLFPWLTVTSQQALFFPLPLLLLIGLYWVRWWATQSPGELLDKYYK